MTPSLYSYLAGLAAARSGRISIYRAAQSVAYHQGSTVFERMREGR